MDLVNSLDPKREAKTMNQIHLGSQGKLIGGPQTESSSAFEIAGGSVIGRDHVFLGKNNQDAYGWHQESGLTIALVCDGCGSGRCSEVGAQLAVSLLLASLRRHARRFEIEPAQSVLASVRKKVLRNLDRTIQGMVQPRTEAIESHFLFTVLGAVLGPTRGILFSLGDGILGFNGELKCLKASGNAPPYLGYGLLSKGRKESAPWSRFQVEVELPIDRFENVLLASDGMEPLCGSVFDGNPQREVRSLKDFWNNVRYFRNPSTLTRQLTKWNRESKRIDWEEHRMDKTPGLFRDDATVIVIRKGLDPIGA